MFDIIFYKMTCEKNRIDKTQFLTEPKTYSGTLRESSSIINPVITVEEPTSALVGYNYCYIAAWNRYYFITDIVAISNFLWEISMRVDVLNTFKTEIKQQTAFIYRTSDNNHINKKLIDDLLPTSNEYSYSIFSATQVNPIGKHDYSIILTTMSDDNTLKAHYGFPLYNRFSTKYLTDWTSIQGLFTSLINDTNFNGDKIWGTIGSNPSECISSVMVYPFDLKSIFVDPYSDEFKRSNFRIGKASLELAGVGGYDITYIASGVLSSIVAFRINLGSFNDFTKYNPFTRYVIYIPFYGFYEVDTDKIDSTKETVELFFSYEIDFDTGIASIKIWQTSVSYPIDILNCKIGMEITIGRTNSAEVQRNHTMNFIKTVSDASGAVAGGIMTGLSPMGAIGGAVAGASGLIRAIANYGVNSINGSVRKFSFIPATSPKTMKYTLNGFLIKYTRAIYKDENYTKLYGEPSSDVTSLSTITGYTEIGEVHLENIPNALDAELTEIETLLKSGVHF